VETNKHTSLRLGAMFFAAGCNKQVFFLEPWKKNFGEDSCCRFQEKCKNCL